MIVICDNIVWLYTFGFFSEQGVEDSTDVCIEWWDRVCARIEDKGFECCRPGGTRRTCHGWNGTQGYKRKQCGLATNEDLSDAAWNELVDIAREEAEILLDKANRRGSI